MAEVQDATIILTSQDNKEFTVSKKAIIMSGLLKDMLEEVSEEENPKIPLPNVNSKPLEKVIEYCLHHQGTTAKPIEKPLKSKLEDCVNEWDAKFVQAMDNDTLIATMLAANYMNIFGLIDLCCAKCAVICRDQPLEEIRKIFSLPNDITPQRVEEMKKENDWCSD